MRPDDGGVLVPIKQSARTFIITVIALGGILMIHAAAYWTGPPIVAAAYVVLAAVASTLKVRLPGIPGTFSANCLITVLAIARLNVTQLVFVSVACALVQSWWRASKPPTRMQVSFNAGVFAISGAASGWTYAALQRLLPAIPPIASLVVASGVFFVINTGAISMVMALIDGVSSVRIWRVWNVWSLPYYLINVGLAILIISLVPASAFLSIAFVVPLMLLSFAAYQRLMCKSAPAVAQVS